MASERDPYPQKQADRARRLNVQPLRPGFLEMGRDRLVAPGVAADNAPPPPDKKEPERNGRGSGGGGEFDDVDPLVVGLFRRLPPAGTEWNAQARAKWLETAAHVFDLIHEGEGGIRIELAMASRSPRSRDHD